MESVPNAAKYRDEFRYASATYGCFSREANLAYAAYYKAVTDCDPSAAHAFFRETPAHNPDDSVGFLDEDWS